MARTSPGADSILDMLKNNTTRIEHEDGFSLQNTSNMNFFRFHKMKSQIEYIRNCLNRLSDIPYTSFIPKVNEIIGASGMSKDEIFDKLLMLPESAEAIIVLFDYSLTLIQVNDYKSDMISYHKVNLKKTIHAKAIFEHLIEYISDGAGLTRGAIKQCWDMMTNDEKLSVQQQIKDKIG
jgi:hypothetical protein